MQLKSILKSSQDQSVNFVFDNGAESRYVRREDDYFICYLSTHNGCNKACRFCHLTQTGQTAMQDSTIEELVAQAEQVLAHYDAVNKPAKRVNYNFMARGEPLASNVILASANELFEKLQSMAQSRGLEVKFNISTIMPDSASYIDIATLIDNKFDHQYYYSLYSMREDFRRRWLPKAMQVKKALQSFKDWQVATGRELALHWAFIEGENDTEAQLDEIANAIETFGLKAKFNVVRYNPFSESQGREPDEDRVNVLFSYFNGRVHSESSRIVPRVGFDVKASCGMFVNE